jgi:hypothetical protein
VDSYVWLLTEGTGMEGDAWGVLGVYETEEAAEDAKAVHMQPQSRHDGTTYVRQCGVEQWSIYRESQRETIVTVAGAMQSLPMEERLRVMSLFCPGCGRAQQSNQCQCENHGQRTNRQTSR